MLPALLAGTGVGILPAIHFARRSNCWSAGTTDARLVFASRCSLLGRAARWPRPNRVEVLADFLVEKLARHTERRTTAQSTSMPPASRQIQATMKLRKSLTSHGNVRPPGVSVSALALKWIVVACSFSNLSLTASDVVMFSAIFASHAGPVLLVRAAAGKSTSDELFNKSRPCDRDWQPGRAASVQCDQVRDAAHPPPTSRPTRLSADSHVPWEWTALSVSPRWGPSRAGTL